MPFHPTRRRLLAASALAATGLVLDDALAEPLAPTPQCHDGQAPTVRQGEGPYFKPSSPERAAFVEPNEWFQGAPILRSKFSVIAQDQIRSLRRELARQRPK